MFITTSHLVYETILKETIPKISRKFCSFYSVTTYIYLASSYMFSDYLSDMIFYTHLYAHVFIKGMLVDMIKKVIVTMPILNDSLRSNKKNYLVPVIFNKSIPTLSPVYAQTN